MFAEEVGLHVCLEPSPIVTVRTLVGLLPSVDADVALQIPRGIEGGLAAVGTDGCEVGEGVVGLGPSQWGRCGPVCLWCG